MNKNTIHLQGIGDLKGIQAKDLKIGDILMWNYGGKTEVKYIEFSKTGKTLKIIERSDGKDYNRKLGANRIVAVKGISF